MEVGGWVQVSLGFFLGENRPKNSPKPVVLICVFCLYNYKLLKVVGKLYKAPYHAVVRGSIFCSDQACYIRCKNLALNIRDCVSLCLSDETLKAVGPFYLGKVKYPTQGGGNV